MREARAGASYLSQNDTRLHFGLMTEQVEQLTIRWPSGEEEMFTEVPVNRLIEIRRGHGLVVRRAERAQLLAQHGRLRPLRLRRPPVVAPVARVCRARALRPLFCAAAMRILMSMALGHTDCPLAASCPSAIAVEAAGPDREFPETEGGGRQ